jgi:hypothetical protein
VVYRSSQCEFCCRREIAVQFVVFSLSFAVCPMRFLVTLFRGGGRGFTAAYVFYGAGGGSVSESVSASSSKE